MYYVSHDTSLVTITVFTAFEINLYASMTRMGGIHTCGFSVLSRLRGVLLEQDVGKKLNRLSKQSLEAALSLYGEGSEVKKLTRNDFKLMFFVNIPK